jgi:uncharacterized phage protein (TIGR01671 family)
MNREILFRGKRVDNGKWEHGSVISCNDGYFIAEYSIYMIAPNVVKLHPETVGQFTGLIDAKDNRIFEGDIIRWYTKLPDSEEYFDEVVTHSDGAFRIYDLNEYNPKWEFELLNELIKDFSCEVIGNIHDK